ncbi:MAG: hypothetical protein NXI25_26765, partial [bacterium]|nr:hypothetical protein [bacterium]
DAPEAERPCRISGHRRLRNELLHADEQIRRPLIVKEHTSDLNRETLGSWGSSLSCAPEV